LTNDTILGIDPGTQTTGWGIIEGQKAIDYGCIRPPKELAINDKYVFIHHGVEELIQRFCPKAVVVETQYVKCNVQSAIKLGMARGAVVVCAGRYGIPVFEYAPSVAKMAVTGTGRASKAQVQGMVQKLLGLAKPPTPEDAADALSLALCHFLRSCSCLVR
jgi:crossover junction endodeoxyribonuclease RuvC